MNDDAVTNLPAIQKRRLAARRGGSQARVGTAQSLSLRLGPALHMRFNAVEFDKLAIDRRYQREEIKPQVSRIVAALLAGGTIPDPITVVRRLFKENGAAHCSQLYWIVDGQQRMWAALETGNGIDAICYDVKSLEEERTLFVLLNTRTTVHANTYIQAHAGATAAFLRGVAAPGHAAADRISFKAGGDQTRVSAATVLHALSLLYGAKAGGTSAMLGSMDSKIQNDMNRALRFVETLAAIFSINPGADSIMGLAAACQERWHGRSPEMPSSRSIARMKRIQWGAVAAGTAMDRRTLIARRILKVWE